MSFWTFVFSVSIAGMVFSYLMRSKELKHRGASDPANAATTEDVLKKLEQMEQRLQSLETIVIERERHHEFDRALNQ